MGDPTEPGQDQESTIIIEGPPPPPNPDVSKLEQHRRDVEAFKEQFLRFKEDCKRNYPLLKIKLKRVEYKKKGT